MKVVKATLMTNLTRLLLRGPLQRPFPAPILYIVGLIPVVKLIFDQAVSWLLRGTLECSYNL